MPINVLENMNLCYGCAACRSACHKDAIRMVAAADGFLYPHIDVDRCVDCGACQTVCPQLHARYKNDSNPKVYAVMADDDIRAKSASGGVFSVLAEYAFERKGCVCGAAFSDDFKTVHHCLIEKPENLAPLRRSKYVQSEMGGLFRQIHDRLERGQFVLFTGTPCQCAAVKSYLKKPYDNLLIVDLICHGASSPLVWDAFLKEIAPGKKIQDVNFRYKGLIGWSATTRVEFTDGTDYTKLFKECNFEQAASKNLVSRKSCGTCQFARVPRQGDLSIGDFWNVHAYSRALDDRKGTSAVLVNSQEGQMVFDALLTKNRFIKVEEVPFFRAFSRNNANVYRFPNMHPGRSEFFKTLADGKKFSDALAQGKAKKYDVALFSIWYAANYGSLMTNFALYKLVSDMGYNCIFADIPDHLWPDSRTHRDPLFVTRRFGNKHFQIAGKYKNRTDLKKYNDLADTFLVGSDQIWNYKLCKSAGTYFYLDFVDDDKKKVAYGTSFGHGRFSGNENDRRTAGYYLNRFDAVSVREDYAVDLCRDCFGVDAVQVLDPVFLCKKEHYLDCIRESRLVKNPPERKYVLAYILDPTEEKQALLEQTAQRLDADLICVPNAKVNADMRKAWRLPIKENIDMEDWLYYFQNAEMVITDSFHGTCFSVIFEKPFIAIGNRRRGLDRFYSLLEKFGLTNRLVMSAAEAMNRDELIDGKIDYSNVNEKLAVLRKVSYDWLKNAMEGEKKAPIWSTYDLLDRRIDGLQKKVGDLTKKQDAQGKSQQELSSIEAYREMILRLDQRNQALEEEQKALREKIERMERSIFQRLSDSLRTLRKNKK